MQFSTQANGFTPTKKRTWWEKFTEQPHQLFFTSAIFFAIFIMILTFVSLLGKSSIDFALLHGFGLNFGLFTNAFLGFLITVMPKYNGSAVIPVSKYLKPWIFYQVAVFFTLFINELTGKVLISMILFYFVKTFYDTIKSGRATIKEDSIYINSILAIGTVLLFIEAITSSNFSILIFFAFILAMVFIVALRMVPSFHFAYTRKQPWQRPQYVRPVSIILFSLVGIFMQFDIQIGLKIVSIISMFFFGYIVYKLDFYDKTPAILFILVSSFIWLELGFIALFIESFFLDYSMKLSFHIFAIGFITTLLIGFGSRVVMGHAIPALPMVADKLTKFLFIFTQIIVLNRILVSVFSISGSSAFTPFLHLTIFAWIVLFVLWTFRYGKTLLRV